MQQSIRDEEKSDREAQLKGKVQYSLPPLDQLLIILRTLFIFLRKTSYLNVEVNCTEPSLSISVP